MLHQCRLHGQLFRPARLYPSHLRLHRPSRAMASQATNNDPHNAYILSGLNRKGATDGPLKGLTVAVKDLYDIKGYKTGFGSPDWLRTHPVATDTSPAVQALLDAGATVVAKTHLDELAYSLNGENAHYGTPVNPAAPGCLPGGSSSGSVVAVAAGEVDIGLGSDTGGSVRVPASYCGTFGLRPTHGRISLQHACPLAPSLDTVGWFTRSAELLQRVGSVLLPAGSARPLPGPPRWLVARDAFGCASEDAAQALYQPLSEKFPEVSAILGAPAEVDIAAGLAGQGLGKLVEWTEVFRVCQAGEVWEQHGEWVTATQPAFGPGIKERFAMAAAITQEELAACRAQRQVIKDHLLQLVGQDGVLVLPNAPGPSPDRGMPALALDDWRRRLLSLTCIAGLAGLPQVALPVGAVEGMPVGLGLIGPPGSDEVLLDLSVRLAEVLGINRS